jgi:hypothetical protein
LSITKRQVPSVWRRRTYYERTEPMLSNVLRDAELVGFARDAVAPLHAYLDEATEILTIGPSSPRPKTPGRIAPRPRLFNLADSRPTASGDQTRRSSSPHSSKPQPPRSAAR